jgi:hypothetical protein
MAAISTVASGLFFTAMLAAAADGADEKVADAKGADAKSATTVDHHSASATAAVAQKCDGSGTTTHVFKHVVKDGKVVELVGDPELLKGADLGGLDAMIADVVKRVADDVRSGRIPDAASLQRDLRLNGAPVEAHVEVKSGAEALQDFEQRFPDLKREVDELMRSVREHRETRPPEPGLPAKPNAKPVAKPRAKPAVRPPARPAAKPVPAPVAPSRDVRDVRDARDLRDRHDRHEID